MTSLLLLGFLLGMRHAMEADHVAAVATLVRSSENLRDSLRHGAFWGIGHTLTLVFAGGLVLLVGGQIGESVAHALEFLVGVLLVVLGIDVLRRVYRERVHFHLHSHGEQLAHFHAHSHARQQQHDTASHRHEHAPQPLPLRSLMVGLMHGLAGASALVLLTLNTVDSVWTGLVYILVFGSGSIAGMALLSVAIAWPLRRSARSMTRLHGVVHYGLGFLTIALGVRVMLENTSWPQGG